MNKRRSALATGVALVAIGLTACSTSFGPPGIVSVEGVSFLQSGFGLGGAEPQALIEGVFAVDADGCAVITNEETHGIILPADTQLIVADGVVGFQLDGAEPYVGEMVSLGGGYTNRGDDFPEQCVFDEYFVVNKNQR